MLSPLESPKRHQDIRARRYHGSGSWLLQLPRFLQWVNNSNEDSGRILCCYGMHGAGKTIIRCMNPGELCGYIMLMLGFSSVVIDDLKTRHGEENVAYIYCDYRDQNNQTAVNILGSLLQQLLFTAPLVPASITTLLESIQKKK